MTVTGFALAAFILAVDQASKFWVLNVLQLETVGKLEVLPFFRLTMVWNRGVSFGLLAADSEIGRWGLVILSGAISVVFAVWLLKVARWSTVLALGMVIGGAIGNMIDRIRFGAVADFFDFGRIFPWVFNVADSAITIGAILVVIDLIRHPDDKPAPPSSADGAASS